MMTVAEQILSKDLGYYLAPPVRTDLGKALTKVHNQNADRVYVIDGREGSGKSTLALQIAYALDPTFNLDQVVFKADGFEKLVRNLGQHKAVVFDEAFNGLSSKGAMSKENKRLVRLLMEVRQRNLFLLIVLPSIFLLEKYVAIFRSQALFHVYIGKDNIRRFKRYNYFNKKLLYLQGKPLMSYFKPRIAETFKFYVKFPECINRDEYDKKKLEAFKDTQEEGIKENRWYKIALLLLKFNKEIHNLSYYKQSKILKDNGCGIDRSNLTRFVKDVPPLVYGD